MWKVARSSECPASTVCTAVRETVEKRRGDRRKTLISKLYAVLIRITVKPVQAQLPPEI